MTPPERTSRAMARQWLKKADEDLAVTQYLVASQRPYYGAAGFHAQQAAEKCLKAFLVDRQIEFPKTHDIEQLLDLVAKIAKSLSDSLRRAAVLSVYGVETRYPTDLPDLTLGEAQAALELATNVRDAVLRAME